MPAIGFPYTKKSMDMKDPIIIIVSHSGGTFSPLACSNLMQSFSSNIFVVTSEWGERVVFIHLCLKPSDPPARDLQILKSESS